MPRALAFLVLALAFAPRAGRPQEDHRHGSKAPGGPEFRINTFTTGNQGSASVAFRHPNGSIVVWESDGQDGAGVGVFGVSGGAEFRVNTYTTGDQRDPSVASKGGGDFVVVWTSPQDGAGDGVFAQRFATSGAPLGPEFQVNTHTTGTQYQAATASDFSGNFVVVWSSVGQEGAGAEVFAQRYASTGAALGPEFRVNTYTTGYQYRPVVGSGGAGFLVVWQDGAAPGGGGGAGRGIFGQRFDSAGAPLGTEFQIETYTTGFQGAPAVAVHSSGDAVVVWHSDGQDGSDLGIFGQRYSASGTPAGSEFQVNSYTTGRQAYPAAAHEWAGIGCFLVAWSSDGEDGSGPGVFSQVYLGGQVPLGAFRVNEHTTGSQARPSVAAVNTEFDHIVVWDSEGQDGSGTAAYGRIDVHFVPVELMEFNVD